MRTSGICRRVSAKWAPFFEVTLPATGLELIHPWGATGGFPAGNVQGEKEEYIFEHDPALWSHNARTSFLMCGCTRDHGNEPYCHFRVRRHISVLLVLLEGHMVWCAVRSHAVVCVTMQRVSERQRVYASRSACAGSAFVHAHGLLVRVWHV